MDGGLRSERYFRFLVCILFLALVSGCPTNPILVPDINIKAGGEPVSLNGVFDLGQVGSVPVDVVFTIENLGVIDLNLSGSPRVATSGSGAFTVTKLPPLIIPAGGSSTFTIRFAPNDTSVHTATVTIASDDPDEDTWVCTVSGSSAAAPKPEINIKQGLTDIPTGGSYDFGPVVVGGSGADIFFTIENLGNADLNLTGSPIVAITGTDASMFAVGSQPTSPVAAFGSTTFAITFAPSSTGPKSATVTVENNDDGEGTYAFALTGEGATGPTVSVGFAQDDPTNASPISATITFSEEVAGFTLGDIDVGNGSASNLQSSDDIEYTVDIAPDADGQVTVDVPGGVAQSVATGEYNTAAPQASITYDSTSPTGTVEINAGADYTNSTDVTLTLTTDDGAGTGVSHMMLSNDSGFTGADWDTFVSPRAWSLISGDGAKVVYVKFLDRAGNESNVVIDSIALDTASPAAPDQPDLDPLCDTGSSSSDGVTKLASGLVFSGGGAEASATVTLYSDVDGALETATANGIGNWSMSVSLTEDVHNIYATVTDPAGNVSTPSDELTVTVDTTAPAAPARPDLDADDDLGFSSTDNLTSLASGLTFSGTAEANASVELSSDVDASQGSVTADAGGNWAIDVALTENSHSITATATDLAGNLSPESAALSVVVDTTAPAATSLLTPFQGQNTGTDLSPSFAWRVANGADYYDFQADDDSGFGTPDIAEEWLAGTGYTPVSDLAVSGAPPVGTRYYFRVRAVDTAGNKSAWSSVNLLRYVNVGRFDDDFNGDGYSDVIAGARRNDEAATDAGKVYIFHGGPTMDTHADVEILGTSASGFFGEHVASAGDVNADGYCDAIVGEYTNDSGGTDAGRAYIYYGGASMDTSADVTLTGAAPGAKLGWDVSSAGDVNADGYCDVIVSTYQGLNAYIYYGGSSMNSVSDVTVPGGLSAQFGDSAGGDFNGDGYSDVVIGGQSSTQARIYFGGSPMNGFADVTMTGSTNFGWSVAATGDLNADGYCDVVIGSVGLNEAYVYFGGSSMDSTADATLTGEASGDNFGQCVSSAGDVDADGYADLVVAAPNYSVGAANRGRAYVYLGGSTVENVPAVTMTGVAAGDLFGRGVASAGDVNRDGCSDVIAGAAWRDAGAMTDCGQLYVFFGSSSMDNGPDVTLSGEASYDYFGQSAD